MFFSFQYTCYSSSLCFLGQCFKLLPSSCVTLALMFLGFMLLLTNTMCGANVFSFLGGPLCINYDLTVTMAKQTSSVLSFKHSWSCFSSWMRLFSKFPFLSNFPYWDSLHILPIDVILPPSPPADLPIWGVSGCAKSGSRTELQEGGWWYPLVARAVFPPRLFRLWLTSAFSSNCSWDCPEFGV